MVILKNVGLLPLRAEECHKMPLSNKLINKNIIWVSFEHILVRQKGRNHIFTFYHMLYTCLYTWIKYALANSDLGSQEEVKK